jgi:alpha-aminoadipate/glutamate carrier protein LysW
MPHCPECEAVVDVEEDDVEEGEIVSCPECGVELEVVHINPLELDLFEEDEDEEESEDGEVLIDDEDEAEDEDEDEE